MPTAITRGAASAKAFGFTSGTGGVGYKYMGQATSSGSFYWGNTAAEVASNNNMITATGISNMWTYDTYAAAGVVNDGQFIGTRGGYSRNNGATWTAAAPYNFYNSYYQQFTSGGVDGGIAYSKTTKAYGFFSTGYDGKYNQWYYYVNVIPTTGSTNTYGLSFGSSPSYRMKQVLYWPLYDAFLVNATGWPYALYANSTTGHSTLNTQGGTTQGGQRWCIDPSSGYLYYNDGLTIYSTNDISFATVSYVGSDISGSYNWAYQSTPIKGPGGYWYKTADTTSGTTYYCTVYISDNTNYPVNWTQVGQVYTGYMYQGHPSLFWDSASNTLYLTCLFYVSGSYGGPFWFTQSSTNGGSTWNTTSNAKMAMTKNFT